MIIKNSIVSLTNKYSQTDNCCKEYISIFGLFTESDHRLIRSISCVARILYFISCLLSAKDIYCPPLASKGFNINTVLTNIT